MRRIVADSGPILHLHEADALALLPCIGEVHAPTAVAQEVHGYVPTWQQRGAPAWLRVTSLPPHGEEQATAWVDAGLLDLGEAEAIALAAEIRADWLLTDDAAARLFAEASGLRTHGSRGVVLWAAAAGHLDRASAESALVRLGNTSLWISDDVLREAQQSLDKLIP